MEETKTRNVYKSKDKQICPFLLTQPNVQFLGVVKEGLFVYFQFAPFDVCINLANCFSSRRAPLVQPKDLLDAVETYRDRVFEMKDKEKDARYS